MVRASASPASAGAPERVPLRQLTSCHRTIRVHRSSISLHFRQLRRYPTAPKTLGEHHCQRTKPGAPGVLRALLAPGGAQSDVASLTAEDIVWRTRAVSFLRHKTGTVSIIRFGGELERILVSLPRSGPLFPIHGKMREGYRAPEFARTCRRLMIKGITLHS